MARDADGEDLADPRGDRRRRGLLRQQPRRRGRRRAPPDPSSRRPCRSAAQPRVPGQLLHRRGRRRADEPAAAQEAPQVGDEDGEEVRPGSARPELRLGQGLRRDGRRRLGQRLNLLTI